MGCLYACFELETIHNNKSEIFLRILWNRMLADRGKELNERVLKRTRLAYKGCYKDLLPGERTTLQHWKSVAALTRSTFSLFDDWTYRSVVPMLSQLPYYYFDSQASLIQAPPLGDSYEIVSLWLVQTWCGELESQKSTTTTGIILQIEQSPG